MKILGIRHHHDGGVALVDDGELVFSHEAEKDSKPRFSRCEDYKDLFELLEGYNDKVDAIAYIPASEHSDREDAPNVYFGHEQSLTNIQKFDVFGQTITTYESTHVRAHIFSSWALSPFQAGQAFYALVYEGAIGTFYHVDEQMNITRPSGQNAEKGALFYSPGAIYGLPFWFAGETTYPWDLAAAGKIMALASYGDPEADPNNPIWKNALEKLFSDDFIATAVKITDANDPYLDDFKFLKVGIDSQIFKDFVLLIQNKIYELFSSYAKENLDNSLPMVISGGCGLNCNWNTDWQNSGLFSDVFVPPCTNDTGLMIGLAAEAQYFLTGESKLNWSAYSGQAFVHDEADLDNYDATELDYVELASFIADGGIVAWAQGRCEIGPRALCHRSLLASPFKQSNQERLNTIKKREGYRPIAPVCLEEDVSLHFDWQGPSPYMLMFQNVKNPDELQAITHVDNTARVQTVNEDQNAKMYRLLKEFKSQTGFGVMCNTSLNYNGTGFINRTSDIVKYSEMVGLDGFVIDNTFYRKRAK